jgi:DNA-binding PadR family transcriptional regulator
MELVDQAQTQQQSIQRALQSSSYDSAESELSKLQDTLEQIAAHDGIDVSSNDLQQSVNQFENKIATGRADRRLTGLFGAISSSRSSAEDCFEEGSYDRARRRLDSAFESVEKATSLNERHDLGKDEKISEKRDQIEELRSEFEQKSREEHSKHITKAEEAISRGIEQREADNPAGAVDAFTEAEEHYDKALKLVEAYELPELWETEQRHSMVAEYLEIARGELEERRHTTRNELEQVLEEAESAVLRAEQYAEVDDHVSGRESLSRAIDHLDEATQLLNVEGVTDQQQSRYDDLVDRAETVQKNLPDEEDSGRYRNQDLVESLQRLATKLGESPRPEFVNEYGEYPADAYLDAFGSWPEALAAANLDSIDESARDRRSYSRVDILDELVRLSNELGHPPSRTEINRKGNISSTTVENRFQDWDTALELANIGKKDSLSDEVAETSGIDSDSETPVETVSNQPSLEDNSGSDKKDQLIESSDATTDVDISSETFAELSAFRRDCLVVINGMDTPKGLEIKDELEQYYDETVNHGRLYPNLDTLEEKGMIEKLELDERSNGYLLTEFGREHLKQRRQWEAEIRDKLASPDSEPVDVDSNSVAVSDAKHDSSSVVWTELKDDTPTDNSFATIQNITEDGRLSRAIAVSVCEISDPSGDRKQSSLLVEDTDGNQCQLNIWKTHSIEVTWTTGHWYVLQHARGKVWTNERGDTERQLSSTDELCVEHVGEDLLSPDEIESSTHPESTDESHTTSATTDEKSGDEAEPGGILDEVVGEFEELSESEEN